MDEYGERLISGTKELGRIVAGDHVVVRKDVRVEEEEEVYINGKLVASDKREVPIIPITDLTNVFYFQYRVDYLEQGNIHPRIVVGICRKCFSLKKDLSRQSNIWALNLGSGDKFTDKRWRDYYPIELNEYPALGFF